MPVTKFQFIKIMEYATDKISIYKNHEVWQIQNLNLWVNGVCQEEKFEFIKSPSIE